MTATLLDRRVGSGVYLATVAGVTVDQDRLGPVTIRGGRRGPSSRPAASTCTLEVDPTALPALPVVGDPVTVDVDAAAAALLGLEPADLRRFTGVVSDADLVPSGRVGARKSVLRLVATGRRARLGRVPIGDTPWPAESDGARAARILTLGGAAGAVDWTGGNPAGWFDQFLGTPTAASVATAPGGDAVRITWLPGSASEGGFAWRYVTPQVVGRTYTITAEVYVPPGQPPVVIDNLFVTRTDPIEGADRWQVITHTYTAPDSADRPVGIGVSPDPARPAGCYVDVRAFRIYDTAEPILGTVDPGTVEVLPRDVDRQPALALLDKLAEDSGSELVELRDGRLEWHQATRRTTSTPAVVLTGAEVGAGVTWSQAVGDLVTDATVVYGPPVEGADRATVRVSDDLAAARHGIAAVRLDTQLAEATDADTLALLTVGRYSSPAWRMTALTVDLLRQVDVDQAAALLALQFGSLLEVTGMPSTAPASSALAWVEGWTESATGKAWRLSLDVSDYALTAPPAVWAEVPADLTWADLPALSWLGATTWRPPYVGAGRWVDLPANLRWSDVDPAATWATFTP